MLALAAFVAVALGHCGGSLQTAALMMAPVLALAVLMATRPYLGERMLAKLAARRARRPVRRVALPTPWPGASIARGGRLIGAALAGRAPPLALAGCH